MEKGIEEKESNSVLYEFISSYIVFFEGGLDLMFHEL